MESQQRLLWRAAPDAAPAIRRSTGMNTQEQNLQILVEHIVNIDTTAEHITAVNSVADMVVQLVAVAGMLPDIAGTIAMRSTLTSVAKKLSAVQNVADAIPLLEAVRSMESDIRAALGVRTEMASVVAHLDAVRSLAAQLDVFLQLPQHAADAKTAAETATEASSRINSQLSKAETARLGAELAENKAKVTADLAADSCAKAATSAGKAQQAADAAAAVSGLPDASAAAPGDPLIWNGSKFAVGTLDETLQSVEGALGLAASVLKAIETAQHTADGVEAKATQAQTDAATARSLAEGVDAKATQAQSNAASAQELAQSVRTEVTAFSGRLSAAESETLRLGEAQNAHAASGDMHHSTAALVERINAAVSAGLAELRDNGTGTLPATHNTLQKLAWLLDAARETVDGFLFGENATDRTAMLNAIEANRAAITILQGDLLLKSDLVDSLDISSADKALSANQGTVLLGMVNRSQMTADSASVPWVKTLGAVPSAWPNDLNPKGLLLICPDAAGDSEGSPLVNPEWYVNARNIPTRLTLDASGIRLADGTTVQSGVASTLAAAQAAQTAATGAQAAATEAKNDAASAKTTAEGVDGKATQAQTDAAEAKTEAAGAKAIAEAIDAKATQAQAEAAAAKTTAEGVDAKATQALADAAEALARSPDLATQTTPGIVKGSDTVAIGEDGSVFVKELGDQLPVGFTALWPSFCTEPAGWLFCNGARVEKAQYPKLYEIMASLGGRPDAGSDLFDLPILPTVAEQRTEPSKLVSLGAPTEGAYWNVSVHRATGDVWAGNKGSSGRVYVWRKATGLWESTPFPAGEWTAVCVHQRTGDVWAGTNGGTLYVLRSGSPTVSNTGQGCLNNLRVIAIHEVSGDVWTVGGDRNASVHVLRKGTGTWELKWLGNKQGQGLCVNQATGDVWFSYNSDGGSGNILVSYGGIGGTWTTMASNLATTTRIACNESTGDIYACTFSTSVVRFLGGSVRSDILGLGISNNWGIYFSQASNLLYVSGDGYVKSYDSSTGWTTLPETLGSTALATINGDETSGDVYIASNDKIFKWSEANTFSLDYIIKAVQA